jgi:hypothetical protein
LIERDKNGYITLVIQEIVTPTDTQADNPHPEEQLPNPSLEARVRINRLGSKRDNNGVFILTPNDSQADNPNTEEKLSNSSPKPKVLEFERDSNGVIVGVTTG